MQSLIDINRPMTIQATFKIRMNKKQPCGVPTKFESALGISLSRVNIKKHLRKS